MIPVYLYNSFYHNLLAFIVIFYVVFLFSRSNFYKVRESSFLVFILFVIITLYIGLRPISYVFGDMTTYASIFKRHLFSMSPISTGDVFFDRFMFESSKIMSVESWFLLCAVLYVYPIYLISVKLGKRYAFYLFLLFISSFSFWAYGTNGIRNGIATSIFLLVFVSNRWAWRIPLLVLAYSVHSSLLLPSCAFILVSFVKNPKYYFFGWLLCIPVSLIAGNLLQGLFAGIIDDGRADYLTKGNINNDTFSSTGFRWDFLLYSSSAVFNAYYFIFKKKFTDPLYNKIVSVYLTANGFWILVIKANFSNRFAYLSWFMMALVIAYPWCQKHMITKQTQKMAVVMLAYFAFTFLMNVILS